MFDVAFHFMYDTSMKFHNSFCAGDCIASPTGRELDGPYLDANEEDIKKQFARMKLDLLNSWYYY